MGRPKLLDLPHGRQTIMPMRRPRLLDLFSGAGGCAMGYHRAGFDVIGVDNRFMPRYPFAHVVADAAAGYSPCVHGLHWSSTAPDRTLGLTSGERRCPGRGLI